MTTHDYTDRHWGHDYTIHDVQDGGQKLSLSGWGAGIRKGDYLLLQNEGSSTRYRIDTITYHADPPDMWHGEAIFSPR